MDRITGPKVWTNEDLGVDQVTFPSGTEEARDGDVAGFGALADRIQEQLEHGPGVALARGVIDTADKDVAGRLLVQLGRLLGKPMRQDVRGALAYEVSDDSGGLAGLALGHSRGATNNFGIGLHTENDGEPTPPHVVMFLCLQPAVDGGETVLGSGYFAHNLLLNHSRSALGRLYEPIDFALRPEDYGDGVVSDAVFTGESSGVRMRYSRYWIERAATIERRPLDPAVVAALDALDGVLADPRIRIHFRLEKGDLLVLDNRAVMHGRSGFTDGIDPEGRRRLLRLWVDDIEGGDRPRYLSGKPA